MTRTSEDVEKLEVLWDAKYTAIVKSNMVLFQKSKITMCCAVLCNSIDCSLPGSSVYGDSPDKNTGVGYHMIHQFHFGVYI